MQKKKGRGCLKGLAAATKRVRTASQKLKIKFSARGGPVDENYWTFVDEVVMFTKKGSTYWCENVERCTSKCQKYNSSWCVGKQHLVVVALACYVSNYVRNHILTLHYVFQFKQSRWDFENVDNATKKILDVANERYKGWRSTLSATYKAYNTYEEWMKQKPEDLHAVEWHYMVLYFGTEKFQVAWH